MNRLSPPLTVLPDLIGSNGASLAPGVARYLANRERMLEAILQSSAYELYVFDRTGRSLFVNAAGATTLGISPDELIRRTAIVGNDLQEIITSWNPAAERHYGYTNEKAIGKSKSLVIPPDQLDVAVICADRRGWGYHPGPAP